MASFHSNTNAYILVILLMKLWICFSSYDATIGDASMPIKNDAMAVAYDENNDTILLIGGAGEGSYNRQFMTFKDNMFTLINETYLSIAQQTFSYSQHYTTLQDDLWMIRDDSAGFITFNVHTYQVHTPSIILQTNVNRGGCLTSTQNYIIVLGGDTLSTVQIYDLGQDMWLHNITNMSQKRTSFSCVVVNDNIYAIGGGGKGTQYLDTIEAFDVSTIDSTQPTEWYFLEGTLSQAAAATRVVQYNADIIVIGGQTADYNRVTDVNRIDTVTGNCDVVGSLAAKTSYAASIVIGNTLHIFGGWAADALDIYQYITLPTQSSTTFPTLLDAVETSSQVPITSVSDSTSSIVTTSQVPITSVPDSTSSIVTTTIPSATIQTATLTVSDPILEVVEGNIAQLSTTFQYDVVSSVIGDMSHHESSKWSLKQFVYSYWFLVLLILTTVLCLTLLISFIYCQRQKRNEQPFIHEIKDNENDAVDIKVHKIRHSQHNMKDLNPIQAIEYQRCRECGGVLKQKKMEVEGGFVCEVCHMFNNVELNRVISGMYQANKDNNPESIVSRSYASEGVMPLVHDLNNATHGKSNCKLMYTTTCIQRIENSE